MRTLYAAAVGQFLQQTYKSSPSALSPIHLLTLIITLFQSSAILFMPSSPTSGNNSVVLPISTVSPTRTLPIPTTKNPTRTTSSIVVESSDTLGLYLTFGTLLIGVIFGIATVYSRGRKSTNPNRPLPRRNLRRGQRSAPSPPPAPDPTENDETNDGTDNGDSDPGNSGNEGSGDGDGDDNNSNDIKNQQEPDNSQSGGLLRDEPDPEDPPPPPPTTLNENDDSPKVTLYGPALSLLHFLIGAFAGLFTKLVTMNATKYHQKLQRLFHNITSRPISMRMGFSKSSFSSPSTVKTLCSCRHQPFIVATTQPRSSLRPVRFKVSLPAPFARAIFKYIPHIVARISHTCIYLVDSIRPPVNWFIRAMTRDLVAVEAYISFAIDRLRVIDTEYGSLWRLIAGYTVLVLVVLEVYHAGLSHHPAIIPNVAAVPCYGDEIMFPFADVDLPLDDPESLRLDIVHPDPTDRTEENSVIFLFRDIDLPLDEAEPNGSGAVQFSVVDAFENNNVAITVNEIEHPITQAKIEHSGQAEVSTDCSPASSLDPPTMEPIEILKVSQDDHEANDTVTDERLPSTSNEDFGCNTDSYVLAAEDAQFEEIASRTPNGEDSHTNDKACIEGDPDTILECLASLFDSLSVDQSSSKDECTTTSTSATEDIRSEVIAAEALNGKDSHAEDEASGEEDPDTILECLAGFFDSPMHRSSFGEESVSGSLDQNEVALVTDSPCRVSGGVCIRAFTSCEAFAAMFGFENETPLEFLRPLPARLERLLPPYSVFPNTPARYFTLGAPPATPTTPYSRWIKEEHQTTPFIPSPFGPPRTPPQTPPTIVIPSPTSSEGTQPPDESPAAVRARRLDRKWMKMMAKRQRNEARNLVPRVHIEETSFSSSIASDTSTRSFFDPHASINRGIRDAETEAGPSKLVKWKPRSPRDPPPRQKRRWRNKDVLVGAGEDESYGAVGVAMD